MNAVPLNPHLHPQERLKADGMKEIKSQPESMFDCWFFEVEEIADPLPSYYSIAKHWKFSDESGNH